MKREWKRGAEEEGVSGKSCLVVITIFIAAIIVGPVDGQIAEGQQMDGRTAGWTDRQTYRRSEEHLALELTI